MTTCPCCGGHIEGPTPLALLEHIRLTGHERAIVNILARRHPRTTSAADLIEEMYSAHYDGGPDRPDRVLAVVLTRLRQKLAGTGWQVPASRTGRGNVARYRLEREQ